MNFSQLTVNLSRVIIRRYKRQVHEGGKNVKAGHLYEVKREISPKVFSFLIRSLKFQDVYHALKGT